ncbi:hypothetical protein BOX15_Mlig027422g1 [Macrostomum lignano]|uniref:UPAR/Ly6 domain-containing protein n=1 Tax=Macrostomum lignano TaxID=282301 RepID=A0A267GMT4_9PLAT|nr:hypothetical protein BOX15_Mlig027422g1 [Macrostomum lignano]
MDGGCRIRELTAYVCLLSMAARAAQTQQLSCYSCSSSKDLSICLSTVILCRSASHCCFKAETPDPRGIPGAKVYSMGCMDARQCRQQPQSSAKDLCSRRGQTCYSCCSDRGLCNGATWQNATALLMTLPSLTLALLRVYVNEYY